MKLSIIIPVYNEERYIPLLLKKVEKANIGRIRKEIIIVDDKSTDLTPKFLKKLKKHKIFFHKKNMGKGAAVRTGLRHATGDIIIIQDADLEYDPNDYKKLIRPIIDKKTKVVYGSRFLKKSPAKILSHYIGNKFLTFITNVLFSSRLTDMETCYKVFAKEVLEKINLRARRFDLEPEITAKILKNRYNIIEVPIRYRHRMWSEGKKITWKDGIKALYYLFKYRIVD